MWENIENPGTAEQIEPHSLIQPPPITHGRVPPRGHYLWLLVHVLIPPGRSVFTANFSGPSECEINAGVCVWGGVYLHGCRSVLL